MKAVLVALCLRALCSAQSSSALDDRVIAAAKQLYVDRLDASLPHVRFHAWLQQQVGSARILWESNDCGEQDGTGKSADVPICGQASATLTGGRELVVMIRVGSVRKGLQGVPQVWFLAVGNKTSTHLSDLVTLLGNTR